MKISVSNIVWNNDELEEHLNILKVLGCDGVEIAPSCIWKEPIEASNEEIEFLRKLVSRYGLKIPAFHALLFTRPELYLFGDKEKKLETVTYLKQLIKLAGKLSVRVMVFGSPASRRVGDNFYIKCYEIAVEVFRELGKEAARYDTIFCIEPLGPTEADFINTADEGYTLVKDVGHSHFGLHLDAKAMVDAGEDFDVVFKKYVSILQHFHVGDPGLAPPGYTGLDHSSIGRSLAKASYDGFVSIEMKKGFGNSIDVIKKSVEYVRKSYLESMG